MTTSRPTVKVLEASVLAMSAERDELRDRLAQHGAVIDDQRRRLSESWAEARELRRRLDALASVLSGAVQITRLSPFETATSLVPAVDQAPR